MGEWGKTKIDALVCQIKKGGKRGEKDGEGTAIYSIQPSCLCIRLGHQLVTKHSTLCVYNTLKEFILTITCATFFLTFSSPSLTALCTSFVSPDCDTANRPPLRPGMSLRLTWDDVSCCIFSCYLSFWFHWVTWCDVMTWHVTLDCTCHVRPRHVCHHIACDDMLCSDISKDITLQSVWVYVATVVTQHSTTAPIIQIFYCLNPTLSKRN